MTLILGIDPGSRATGYGVIEAVGNRLRYVACGCIRTTGDDHPQRLRMIFEGLGAVIEEFSPQECAIEDVFLGKSVSSALKLGQARGSALVACMTHDLPVSEYTARTVKQSVTGSGAGDKLQVQHMVRVLLGLRGKLQADAADALAIAICHANTRDSLIKVAAASGFRRGRYSSTTGT